MPKPINFDIVEFKRQWIAGVPVATMAAHFGTGNTWISRRASDTPGLTPRQVFGDRTKQHKPEPRIEVRLDPVAAASMIPGLMAALARTNGSVRMIGTIAAKYAVPYAVLNTLAQQGAAQMNRTQTLEAAIHAVNVDRDATHGNPENTFGLIAAYWSAHLDTNVTATDVAAMMALMKLARIKGNPGHNDSWTDACGYLACGAEIATRTETDK